MLKMTGSSGSASRALEAKDEFVRNGGGRTDKTAKNLSKFNSLTNVSFSGLSRISANLSSLHQVLIYRIHTLPQLQQFLNSLWAKQTDEASYKANIGQMRLRLVELQELDEEAKKIRATEEWQEG